MDTIGVEQGQGWAQVAPLIVERQRAIAERAAAEAVAARTPEAPRRVDVVEATRNSAASKDTATGEAGLGQPTADDAERAAQTNREDAAEETDARGLTEAEAKMVKDLSARDAEVRRHEQAHATVGGQYASSPTYTYQSGPDGRNYAIGGEVQIDVSPEAGDPEATIAKMQVVKSAALAPAEPSAADRQVAALADALRTQAVAQLAQQRADERSGAVDVRA